MCRTKLEPKPRRRFSFSKTNSFIHLCTVIYKALKRKSVVALKNAHNPTKTKAIATPYPITSSAIEISACYIWLLRHLRHFSSVTLQCQQHVYVVVCVYVYSTWQFGVKFKYANFRNACLSLQIMQSMSTRGFQVQQHKLHRPVLDTPMCM